MSAPKVPKVPTEGVEGIPKSSGAIKKKKAPVSGDTSAVQKLSSKASQTADSKTPSLPQDAPSPVPSLKKKKVPKPAADVAPPTPIASDELPDGGTENIVKQVKKKKKQVLPVPEPDSQVPEVEDLPKLDQPKIDQPKLDNPKIDQPKSIQKSNPLEGGDAPKAPIKKKKKLAPVPIPEPEPEPEESESEPELDQPEEEEEEEDENHDGEEQEGGAHVQHGDEHDENSQDDEDDQSEDKSEGEEEDDEEEESPLANLQDAPGILQQKVQDTTTSAPDQAQKGLGKVGKIASGAASDAQKKGQDLGSKAQSTAKGATDTVTAPRKDSGVHLPGLPGASDLPVGGDALGGVQDTAQGIKDKASKPSLEGGKKKKKSDGVLGGLTDTVGDKVSETGKSAQSTAGGLTEKVQDTAPGVGDTGAGDALGGVTDTATGLGDKAGQTVSGISEKAPSGLGDATSALGGIGDQAKGAVEGGAEQLGGVTSGVTDNIDDKVNGVGKLPGDLGGQATGIAGQAAGTASGGLDPVTSLTGSTVDSAGNIVDQSGKTLGKATGDLKSLVGKTVNDAGEIVDSSGKVLGRVSDVATGELAKVEPRYMDDVQMGRKMGGANVSVSGIEIRVEATKDGTILTIKIPGSFQQQ